MLDIRNNSIMGKLPSIFAVAALACAVTTIYGDARLGRLRPQGRRFAPTSTDIVEGFGNLFNLFTNTPVDRPAPVVRPSPEPASDKKSVRGHFKNIGVGCWTGEIKLDLVNRFLK